MQCSIPRIPLRTLKSLIIHSRDAREGDLVFLISDMVISARESRLLYVKLRPSNISFMSSADAPLVPFFFPLRDPLSPPMLTGIEVGRDRPTLVVSEEKSCDAEVLDALVGAGSSL